MTKFESAVKVIPASQKAVYEKLSDLSNLEKVKDRLSYLYLPPFGKAVLIMNEGTAKAFLINIFLLFQTVDYAVYGIIGNTPTLQLLRNFRTAMLRSGAISSHAA